jgi:hypothetical protein
MPPAGFELTIPASERPQTYALGGTATATGYALYLQWFTVYLRLSTRKCNIDILRKLADISDNKKPV